MDFSSKLEKPPLLVVFFSKVRILFRIDFQSSTFGYEKKSILNKIWWTFDGVAGQNLDLA